MGVGQEAEIPLEAVVTQTEGGSLTSDKGFLLYIFLLLTKQGRLLGGGGSFPVTFPSWAQMGHMRPATLAVVCNTVSAQNTSNGFSLLRPGAAALRGLWVHLSWPCRTPLTF